MDCGRKPQCVCKSLDRFLQQRQNEIKRLMAEYQLVDAWVIRYPGIRDYTYFSVEHQLLSSFKDMAIKTITLSEAHREFNWKLNDSLIHDPKR